MATYAIGDVQGCFYAFQSLLDKLSFDAGRDSLWFVGDMINRGTGSLEMLRWCVQHEHAIQVVLGNHDLHAIAVAHAVRPPHRNDTLQPILDAEDGLTLLTWLRHQPLMLQKDGFVMVHAGLLPQWTVTEAASYAHEVEQVLRAGHYGAFLHQMYGNHPTRWQDDLTGMDRLRLITNAFTRLRICKPDGELDYVFKGELADIPPHYMPWFMVPDRKSKHAQIICGHWSALGLYQQHNIHALDTGCLWGGQLTAMCLENKQITQVPFDARDRVSR